MGVGRVGLVGVKYVKTVCFHTAHVCAEGRLSKVTRGGTRTRNLLLRREAPYPLGYTSCYSKDLSYSPANRPGPAVAGLGRGCGCGWFQCGCGCSLSLVACLTNCCPHCHQVHMQNRRKICNLRIRLIKEAFICRVGSRLPAPYSPCTCRVLRITQKRMHSVKMQ